MVHLEAHAAGLMGSLMLVLVTTWHGMQLAILDSTLLAMFRNHTEAQRYHLALTIPMWPSWAKLMALS